MIAMKAGPDVSVVPREHMTNIYAKRDILLNVSSRKRNGIVVASLVRRNEPPIVLDF